MERELFSSLEFNQYKARKTMHAIRTQYYYPQKKKKRRKNSLLFKLWNSNVTANRINRKKINVQSIDK